jgi:uncharacterized protein YjdB
MSITAKGAQGGVGLGYTGGSGAIMTGTFTSTPGHVLKIIAGGQPTCAFGYAGGGGGGSFVWDVTGGNVLLVAAGGGGGGGTSGNGIAAVTANNGTNGGGGATYGGGGTAGNGGTTPSYVRYAGGGTGWLNNGAAGLWLCVNAGGGIKPLTSGAGGGYGGNVSFDGPGGFGGGGGAQGGCTSGYGGGGGGYSGGGAGAGPTYYGGGGGGSFNAGAPQSNSVGNTGNGVVYITPLCTAPVPGVINGPSSVCVGAAYSFTDPTATLGGTFGTTVWTSTNPLVALAAPTTGVVSGLTPGIDTIKYTITLTCGTASTYKVITVNPLPTPIYGYAEVCPGSTIVEYDTTAGGKWSSMGTSVATIDSNTGLLTGVTAGSALISYTLSSTGCASSRTIRVVSISGPPTICNGDSLVFTSTGSTGVWSSSSISNATVNSADGMVTGTGMGSATIIYTLASGCSVTAPVSINALAPVLGTDSVCVGGDRYLTDIVGGGHWATDNPLTATVHIDSGRVHGVTVGFTNITYSLPNGCKSWVTFNVIDYPPAPIGVMRACPQTTTVLVDAVGPGWWTSGNPSIATVDSSTGTVTGQSADTVDIFYTISPGCTVYATVTINPLPAPVTGMKVICPGTIDSLGDITPFGKWSSVTPTLGTVDSIGIVTGIGGGDAQIQYTIIATGCSQIGHVTVDPLPVPVVTYNWISATLYTTTGYQTYQWYDSLSGKIIGATTPSVALTNTDYYWVEVTDGNGCKGKSGLYHYNISQVGVHAINANGISIYPNPTNGTLFIHAATPVRAVISNIAGKTELDVPNATELDLNSLPAGMYFVAVYDESGARITTQKIIRQ